MAKYTIEELLQLKPSVPVEPVNFDAREFRELVEKVKQLQALREEEFGHFSGRRRSSHHHGRPKVKPHKPKVTTDEDGWSTFEPKQVIIDEEGDEVEKNGKNNKSSDSLQEIVKVRPNNKNISSSRPADNKDIIADKQINGFNAFAALESEDEDDE